MFSDAQKQVTLQLETKKPVQENKVLMKYSQEERFISK